MLFVQSEMSHVPIPGQYVLQYSEKGTNGVSTNGVTANSTCFDRETFWVLPLTYFYMFIFPKVPGHTFFPNLSKIITFAAAQLVLTPFVRNQLAAMRYIYVSML